MSDVPAFEAVVNIDLFRAVMPFVGTEDTRYYLKGVHIAPAAGGGVRITATDGHRLAIGVDPNGSASRDAIIQFPRNAWTTWRRGANWVPNDKRVLSIATAAHPLFRPVFGSIGGEHVAGHELDGSYPDAERVIPRHGAKPASTMAVDPRLLATLHDAARIVKGGRFDALPMVAKGPAEPHLTTVENGGLRLLLVFMPKRPPDPLKVPDDLHAFAGFADTPQTAPAEEAA